MKTCSNPGCQAENFDMASLCRYCGTPLRPSGQSVQPTPPTKPLDAARAPQYPVGPSRAPTIVEGEDRWASSRLPPTYREDTPLPPRRMSPRRPEPAPALNAYQPPATLPVHPHPTATPPVQAPPSGEVRSRPRTQFLSPPSAESRPQETRSQRKRGKIIGVLVTYSWHSEGRIYPILEGRNLIGRDPECDICIHDDHTMSGRNTHITFWQKFVVGDLVSMIGTDLNGVPIEEQFRTLENFAIIRAGSTYFTFVAFPIPGTESGRE